MYWLDWMLLISMQLTVQCSQQMAQRTSPIWVQMPFWQFPLQLQELLQSLWIFRCIGSWAAYLATDCRFQWWIFWTVVHMQPIPLIHRNSWSCQLVLQPLRKHCVGVQKYSTAWQRFWRQRVWQPPLVTKAALHRTCPAMMKPLKPFWKQSRLLAMNRARTSWLQWTLLLLNGRAKRARAIITSRSLVEISHRMNWFSTGLIW